MKHKIRSDTAASFLHINTNSVNKIFVLNRYIFSCFSETPQKLCLSVNFQLQEIRLSYNILCSVSLYDKEF